MISLVYRHRCTDMNRLPSPRRPDLSVQALVLLLLRETKYSPAASALLFERYSLWKRTDDCDETKGRSSVHTRTRCEQNKAI